MAVDYLRETYDAGLRRSCGLLELTTASYAYQPKGRDEMALIEALKSMAQQYRRWGYRSIYDRLRLEGWDDNHKRVYRVYREQGLQLSRRKKRKTAKWRGETLPPASGLNEVWAMDFVSDQLADGRKIRMLNIIDLYSRECLAIEVDTSISGVRVSRVLSRIIETRGKPAAIQTDNGPEFTSRALDQWAYKRGIKHHFIEPGKPTQNAHIESFNSLLRDGCLNQHWFVSLQDSKELIDSWKYEYNWIRCHRSLGRIPPGVYAQQAIERKGPPSAPTSNGTHSRGAAAEDRNQEEILSLQLS
jgi:putative transposase